MAMYLETSDKKVVEVEAPLIRLCGRLIEAREEAAEKNSSFGTSAQHPLTGLENLDSRSLEHVLQWLRQHADDPSAGEESEEEEGDTLVRRIKGGRTKEFRWKRRYMYVPHFDKTFLDALDNLTLIGVVNTSYQLKVKRLMDYACRAVADRIKGKSVEEMRELFGIENDWTECEDNDKEGEGEDITLLSIDKSRTANYKWKCTGP